MSHHDPDDEDWYDDEDPAAERDGHSLPCPECGTAIYADVDHCPQCGHWLTDADRRSLDRDHFPSRRVRIVAIVLLALFALGLLADLFGTF